MQCVLNTSRDLWRWLLIVDRIALHCWQQLELATLGLVQNSCHYNVTLDLQLPIDMLNSEFVGSRQSIDRTALGTPRNHKMGGALDGTIFHLVPSNFDQGWKQKFQRWKFSG
jgi:hypothetical protein